MDPLDYSGNVHHWAGRYHRASLALGLGLDRDDFASIGWVALLKARRTHRANRRPDATFPGYATAWIRGQMARALRAAEKSPRPPHWSRTPDDPPLEDVADRRGDDGEDEAAAMLRPLPDRQALALELHLGLDGTPGRPVRVVADMMRGNAERLIKDALDNLRRHHPAPTPTSEA